MRIVWACCFVCSSFFLSAQEKIADDYFNDSTIRILIVPYSRIEFHTEFSIDDIAEINTTVSDSIYAIYRNALLHVLLNSSLKNIEFILSSENDEKIVRMAVKYSYSNKPQRHYMANLSAVDKNKFAALLGKYQAQMVLFINWYKIEKTYQNNLSGSGKARKPFAEHYIDFDVVDKDKTILFCEGKFYFKATKTNAETIESKNLRIKEVKNGYQILPLYIYKRLGAK